jgi:molecular chaperone DnaK (HSP70)
MARTRSAKYDGFGIDFGTTNSVVALASRGDPIPRTWQLLDDGHPHPSVVWYQVGRDPVVGRAAKNNMLGFADAAGNFFVSSIKRSLGKGGEVSIFGTKQPVWAVASEVFKHLKHDAARNMGVDLNHAVVTIPVDFDGRARRELRKAADHAGIFVKTFVHEPFAAVVGYLYSEKEIEKLAAREGQTILVFDWGGGTLDITVAKIQGGMVSQLENAGLADHSGDHFDHLLANYAKSQFQNRARVPAERFILQSSAKDRLRTECELRKIDLSSSDEASIELRHFYQADGHALDLQESVTRAQFNEMIQSDVEKALATMHSVLERASLRPADVDLALTIGGTSRIPKIREEMRNRFGTTMVHVENADTVIAEGAAIVDALNLQPVLARPICIELSDGSPYELFKAGTITKRDVCSKEVVFFCTDNRDGQARLIVKEGTGPFKDKYVKKSVLNIPVSPDLPKPYNHERVTARFVIDEDLVLRVSAKAATQPEGSEGEVYDLHFALKSFGDT